MISLIGRLARNYIGRKLIALVDQVLLRVPILNKIYGAIKQVNEALGSSNKTSFKQVVLVEFPRAGQYSVGFLTGEDHREDGVLGHRRQMLASSCTTAPTERAGLSRGGLGH